MVLELLTLTDRLTVALGRPGQPVLERKLDGARQHAAALMDAMIADHERSTGPWEIEWIVLPEAFCLMAGALKQSLAVLEGLEVDAQAMRRNIDMTAIFHNNQIYGLTTGQASPTSDQFMKTPSTPGMDAAFVVSMRLMRACP